MTILTKDEMKVLDHLILLTMRTFDLLDNSEHNEHGIMIEKADFDMVARLLELLDELPDDRPNYTMGVAAKVQWALRRIIDKDIILVGVR